MLAVHWTPVNNTKHILKNGIKKSKGGVYCFPLTGHKSLDKWWATFFNQCFVRGKKRYNGIVFRITQQDMPAAFSHWVTTVDGNFDKPVKDLNGLGEIFRETIIWRLGERIAYALPDTNCDHNNYDICFERLGNEAIQKSPKALMDAYRDLDLMSFSLEDYQILLSHSIPAKRIIKVIPQGNEFGRVLRKEKLRRGDTGYMKDQT